MLTKSFFFLSLLTTIVLMSCNSNSPFDFKLKTISGETIQLSKTPQPIRIVNFWASWCEPCLLEIPDFIRLQQEYSKSVAIFGLNIDQNHQQVHAITDIQKKFKINYPLLITEGYDHPKIEQIVAIPTTYIVDSLNQIVKVFTGYTPYQSFKTEIDHILAQKSIL